MAPERSSSPTYLITGASRGLGLELVSQLLAHSSQPIIVAAARSPSTATALQTLAAQHPGRVHIIALDTADKDSIKAVAQWVDANLDGRLDVLINNAGKIESPSAKWHELSFDEAASVFHVNTIGPLVVSAALLPALRRGGKKQIIHISSAAGSISSQDDALHPILRPDQPPGKKGISRLPATAVPVYRASKAALNMEMLVMAGDLAPEGFTVVSLHPGFVATDMGNNAATGFISAQSGALNNGALTPLQSVLGLVDVIGKLTPKDNGKFVGWNGATLPW